MAIDDSNLIIHNQMKRCILSDAGEVQYYLHPNDSTLKEDGVTPANLDGTDGQVMVEIPKFWYSYDYNSLTNTHVWMIAPGPVSNNYSVHPAFNKNGSEVDYRYIGAYEGSMYDASAGTMTPSGSINTEMYASGDKLCSISGVYPKTHETRDEFRSMAAERGNGWRQQDYDLVSAIQLLYIVEYATWNSQNAIGEGRTNMSGGDWDAGSYIGECGKSNKDGNGTNSVDGNTDDAYMVYRGIENFFGNIWKYVDGLNIISDNIPYVTNDDSDFADDTTTNYTRLEDINGDGITLPSSNEYQVTLEQIDRGFLPASVGGSDSTYICDYYYQSSGDMVAMLGGNSSQGTKSGFFYWGLFLPSSFPAQDIGSRLAY